MSSAGRTSVSRPNMVLTLSSDARGTPHLNEIRSHALGNGKKEASGSVAILTCDRMNHRHLIFSGMLLAIVPDQKSRETSCQTANLDLRNLSG